MLTTRSILPLALVFTAAMGTFLANSQAGTAVVVSVPDQEMAVVKDGLKVATFPVSTSKFGVSDRPRSYGTPLGTMEVAAKIGQGAPIGSVFKHRQRTGEILKPNSPGRDPIVTRILWLKGTEAKNCQAFGRNIYIHGTPEERKIGRPASYGCIRMRSKDVVRVFESVPVGARVEVVNATLRKALKEVAATAPATGHAG